MAKAIWFDMDGTIYNLYKIPNWLDCLRNNNMEVFNQKGYARKSLPKIRKVIRQLKANGWTVGIITWAPMDVRGGSLEFRMCYAEKMAWVREHIPELVENFHCLEYGIEKCTVVHDFNSTNILVDDNKMVRNAWRNNGQNFLTINANRGYLKELEGLLG